MSMNKRIYKTKDLLVTVPDSKQVYTESSSFFSTYIFHDVFK